MNWELEHALHLFETVSVTLIFLNLNDMSKLPDNILKKEYNACGSGISAVYYPTTYKKLTRSGEPACRARWSEVGRDSNIVARVRMSSDQDLKTLFDYQWNSAKNIFAGWTLFVLPAMLVCLKLQQEGQLPWPK